MVVTHVEQGYRITIPEPFRQRLHVGDELVIEMNDTGQMMLSPTQRILEILERTSGLWRNHNDQPADGVAYVNILRQGRRLAEQREDSHESD